MTRSMFIDASHAEETRVVVLDGKRLDDFDIETTDRKQIKGNIYLAKIVRVEPSLQAAFVDYGGNRHGFLAFSEIHPDYYQIPVADRQKLLELEAEEARRRIEAEDAAALDTPAAARRGGRDDKAGAADEDAAEDDGAAADGSRAENPVDSAEEAGPDGAEAGAEPVQVAAEPAEPPEQLGGDSDAAEEARDRRRRMLRNYKIQEVMHRRQVVLVQVLKEERGNKGAALSTYISLAGRFSVLMPNSPNGGGVSRKITAPGDRKRLKEVISELDVPEGMGMIVRTAGAQRPKPEIKRDGEYLLRLWDDIRERTLASIAPALIYEEAALIKRAIRDVYTREIEEILVDGEEGFRTARDFMRMLMPSHVRKVQVWQEKQPLFSKQGVEHLLDQIFQPTVQLPSGGYLVINQTEALVAIDVNSGRSTRERSIEDTAVRTNLEAADEVARQLRLRDLAGLIVVDFIDMDARKNNAMVERRLKEALKADRARIQVGSISHFGLLEMSRQRLRPSLAETMLSPCPQCGGTGHVRSAASLALAALRTIEDEGAKHGNVELAVHVPADVALYLFNHKRLELASIEERFGLALSFVADGQAHAPCRVEKLRAHVPVRRAEAPVAMGLPAAEAETEEAAFETEAPQAEEAEETAARGDGRAGEEAERSGRRRRRRRRRRDTPEQSPAAVEAEAGEAEAGEATPVPAAESGVAEAVPEPAPEHVTGAQAVVAAEPATVDSAETPEVAEQAASRQADDQPDLAGVPVEFGEPAEVTPKPRARRPARPRRSPRRQEAAESESVPAEATATAAAAAEDTAAGASGEEAAPRRRRRPVRRRTKPEEAAAQEVEAAPVFTDVADIFEAAEDVETRRVTPAVEPLPEAAPAPLRVEVRSVTSEAIPLESKAATPVTVQPVEQEGSDEVTPVQVETGRVEEGRVDGDRVDVDSGQPEQDGADDAQAAEDAPRVRPVVIGATEAAPEPKRGWWRR